PAPSLPPRATAPPPTAAAGPASVAPAGAGEPRTQRAPVPPRARRVAPRSPSPYGGSPVYGNAGPGSSGERRPVIGATKPPRTGASQWRNPAATYSPRGPPPKYHRRWRA